MRRALLDVAEQDILALQALLAAAEVGDRVFGFHARQVAEKSLKAWLALRGVRFPLTHDLRALIALLQEQVDAAAFQPLAAYVSFGVQFRCHATEGDVPIDQLGALRQAKPFGSASRRSWNGLRHATRCPQSDGSHPRSGTLAR